MRCNAEEEEEADVLIDRLDATTTRYKIEVGLDKTKVMTHNPNDFQRHVKKTGLLLEEVDNSRHLGPITNEVSTFKILIRVAQETAPLTKLKRIWKHRTLRLLLKHDADAHIIFLPLCLQELDPNRDLSP